ncbi:MAG: hypothetical protein RMJ84_07720, partial [Sandaracinaceae bacterium]|nr:hypothetical protein [Sandaracinaceae bacterium]
MMKAQGPAENASPFNRLLTPRFQALLGSLWVMVHVLIPLRYYLWPGHDRYDERFSWRMFSAVRVERCRVKAWVEESKGERLINLPKLLPMPWVSL